MDYQKDIDLILAKRAANGGEYWASEDGRVYVGHPFSTIGALGMLYELGFSREHEAVRGALDLIWAGWRDDGRIRIAPKAPLHPCFTAEAARMLCRFGFAGDERMRHTVRQLLANAQESGGWRCSFSRFGRGPETRAANPGATLFVLDVLRFTGRTSGDPAVPDPAAAANPDPATDTAIVDAAVESLLSHWETRAPLGPCHYGIGSRFLQVEYPFLRYNLFYYVYVLSHYSRALSDGRFAEAAAELAGHCDEEGNMIVDAPHRHLKGLAFCERGRSSPLATARWREIRDRIDSASHGAT